MMNIKIFFLFCFVLLFAMSVQAQTDTFHLDETYSIDTQGTINLNSDDAEVTIRGSKRDDIHITVNYKLETDGLSFGGYEPFDMKVWTEDGNIYLKEQLRDMDRFIIGNTDETYEIIIEAPYAVRLMLKGDDENYDINKIAGEVRIDADDASITCTNCTGRYFAYQLDDGSIRMNSGSGILKVDFDDGSANISNSSFKKIKIRGDDPSINLQNQAQPNGQYRFSLDDANLDLDLVSDDRSGPIQVSIDADDASVTVRTLLKDSDTYRIRGGDASIEFYAVDGGGKFYIQHDDVSVSAGRKYQILLNNKGISKYRLDGGDATIKIDVDDANIALY